jgi:hypothetical protein
LTIAASAMGDAGSVPAGGLDDDRGACCGEVRVRQENIIMAICWDTTGCNVPLPANDQEADQRDTLIFLAARIECGDLTRDTLREWMVRVLLVEKLCNMNPLFGGVEGLRSALHRWCGMVTNCAHVERGEWITEYLAGFIEQAENAADAAIEEAATFVPLGAAGSR